MKLEKDIVIPANLEINPYVYLDIILKFQDYIKLIYSFGGYMFVKQIYKFSSKVQLQTFQDIHSMEDSKLLKIININNNNYVILTKTSIKYLKNKKNISYIELPTSTQLKACCYLAEYISNPSDFFNPKNPYTPFLNRYKNELDKYKNNDKNVNMNFLKNNKDYVKIIKEQEIKSEKSEDIISKLNRSRIYFDDIKDNFITLLILDFDRNKNWIYKSLLEKIEPVIKSLKIYTGYNIKVLTESEERKKFLINDIKKMQTKGLMFLKDISVINLEIGKYFRANKQTESFLKNIDVLEIKKIKERLKSN
ncbi:hypothetical protein [Clostridium pasteurianum]|uniref:Uncharacterized protein n=1 Tax=Clostridium pasteurianum BC1 TaxID=86416 RepID=R4K0L1_CLOPA|nr:hypothetical protein [Clostridium pasteurianum]AGK96622.1 hypothetical protein Clopa_1700 [Clostridium pasteurianum BC1]